MSLAALIRSMAEAGATVDMIVAAVEAHEACATAKSGQRRAPSQDRVWVYVMAHDEPDSKLTKVGISQNPEFRRETLEREESITLSVAYTEGPFTRARALEIERATHRRLDDFRQRGEWFSCGALRATGAVRNVARGAA